jgi:sialate O-acetylesterase
LRTSIRACRAVFLLGIAACSSSTEPRISIPEEARLEVGAAELTVSPIFRTGMVLQREAPVSVFGTATPGTNVTVQLGAQAVSTAAGADGKWQITLAAMAASSLATTMTVSAGTSQVSFSDVQVGEVWLCSGQSNMGRPLSSANGGSAAITDAVNHNIRLFRMTGGKGPATSNWTVSNSTTAAGFSAVCYWMGLELSQQMGVPVGLIQATHDGTAISSWMHGFGGTGEDYDAMVRAIQPYAIRGVAWYQGESNGGDTGYEQKLTSMIGEWRGHWGAGALPFGIVQLTWRPSGWTPAREAQLRVSQSVANTFLVVTTDLPVSNSLHPSEKKPVGIRLAIGARGAVYGEAIDYSGPIRNPATVTVSGNVIILEFSHIGNGLFTSDGKPPGPFKVAGANGRFQTATATIDGNTVRVSSVNVASPKTVRLGWDYGVSNLYNRVSIPVQGGGATVDRLPASHFELRLP